MKASKSVVALIAVVAACSTESVRLPDETETAAILASLIPKQSAETPFCLVSDLRPPLEHARNPSTTESSSFWERTKAGLKNIPSRARDDEAPSDWIRSRDGKALQLRTEDARHLDALLVQATKANLTIGTGKTLVQNALPTCGKPERDPGLPMALKAGRVSFSQPVIIGNIAFVEHSVVCGELCGTGGLTALIRRNGKWLILADQMTWIA